MSAKRPPALEKLATLQVPFGSESGVNYHTAIQLDQQGQHDLAAAHYHAAASAAEPGQLRDFCLDRYRALTIGKRLSLTPSVN